VLCFPNSCRQSDRLFSSIRTCLPMPTIVPAVSPEQIKGVERSFATLKEQALVTRSYSIRRPR
jgi:hypothetical protein